MNTIKVCESNSPSYGTMAMLNKGIDEKIVSFADSSVLARNSRDVDSVASELFSRLTDPVLARSTPSEVNPEKAPLVEPFEGTQLDGHAVQDTLQNCPSRPEQGGEGGEGGAPPWPTSNAEFAAAVFREVDDGATPVVCTKSGDPSVGGWHAKSVGEIATYCLTSNNNYLNCSTFRIPSSGGVRAIKDASVACHFLMLDDLGSGAGSKFSLSNLHGLELTWLTETSPGNHQAGLVLTYPVASQMAERILKGIQKAGLCDGGASGPGTRWARLPFGINGKPEYEVGGDPFMCHLVQWNPEVRHDPKMLLERFAPGHDVQLDEIVDGAGDVLVRRPLENPVITALKKRKLYKRDLGDGKHDVTCPWALEHTDSADTGAAYFEPKSNRPCGGFKCQHSHGETYRLSALITFLGLNLHQCLHKPVITIRSGSAHEVVDAAEQLLAESGVFFQNDGAIVTVGAGSFGEPRIDRVTVEELTMQMSSRAVWLKQTTKDKLVRVDPPTNVISLLYGVRSRKHLPGLVGFARQPFFRESDKTLVNVAGYDVESKLYGVFKGEDYALRQTTKGEAEKALASLNTLVAGFPFASEVDRSVALSALFTAVVRPSLDIAPGFHVSAPVIASGKTYLCELISNFASPSGSMKVNYPKTADEANKSVISLLMAAPAVIEFDDMDTDWYAHSTIKQMFTSPTIGSRLLGGNTTINVSTRTLVLGSANNKGPIDDLTRRVLTIHLDPQTQNPATAKHDFDAVGALKGNRGKYVSDVLTIIRAYEAAGAPKSSRLAIASFDKGWSDYCRHPLVWLGVPDPVAAVVEQLKSDPDVEAIGWLMEEWTKVFNARAVPIRDVIKKANAEPEGALSDAINQFSYISENGKINASKFGRFIARYNKRIINGRRFQKVEASTRTCWELVPVLQSAPRVPPPTIRLAEGVLPVVSDDALEDQISKML